MANVKKRINLNTFDLLKGFSMICVVITHSIFFYDSDNSMVLSKVDSFLSIGFFIMPALFMVSGYGFKERDVKKGLKKTAEGLLVPYLWITLAYLVLYPIINVICGLSLHRAIKYTARYVVSYLLGITVYEKNLIWLESTWNTAAWFFLASFIALNVLNLILKLKSIWRQVGCVGACVIVSIILYRVEFFYFDIPQGLMAASFCYIGYIIKKYSFFDRLQSSPITYIILIPIATAEFMYGSFNMSGGGFHNVVLDYIGSGCGGLLLVLIAVALGRLEWKCLDWLKQIGVYTYWILAVHSFEMDALPWGDLPLRASNHRFLSFCIEMVMKAVLLFIACYCLKQISKYKYRRRMARNVQQRIH